MDDEHKVLIKKMNDLHKAWLEKAPPDHLGRLLEDLGAYTVKHFKDEEAYMEKTKYEGLATHKIIHQSLLKEFQQYAEEFKQTKALREYFFNFLKVWLSSHIRGIDMKYSPEKSKSVA